MQPISAICHLSVIPVRKEPLDSSEMVTQIQFGEILKITEQQGSWAFCTLASDSYQGWIDKRQVTIVSTDFIKKEETAPKYASCKEIDFVKKVADNQQTPILKGSLLPMFKEGFFYLNDEKYSFEGNTSLLPSHFKASKVAKTALGFLNTPYLWGGKTIAGMDCSGLVQTVFRWCGLQLPRDAWQQAQLGNPVDFVEEAIAGDLAFFQNADGRIIHVGIILEPGKIIHASGQVRIDPFDHNGIFNEKSGTYSHNLRIIKRMT